MRTARANRILETSDRFKKELGDRFVFYGGEDNGAEQWNMGSAMPEKDCPRAKCFEHGCEVSLPQLLRVGSRVDF